MTATPFIAARGLHFAACLLLLCICVFDRFIAWPAIRNDAQAGDDWSKIFRALAWIAAAAALATGILWFAAVVSNMSGNPLSQSFTGKIPSLVWRRTSFGKLWHWRFLFWIATTAAIAGHRKHRKICGRFALLFASLLVGSLAWTGHGSEGRLGNLHLAADVVHLLCAACWPAGLLPLLLLLRRIILTDKAHLAAPLARRFSTMSLISVSILLLTGLANSYSLLGSKSDLIETPYGRVLLAKICCFLLMVAIGAVNLLLLEPRFTGDANSDAGITRRMKINVLIETILAAAVILLVAFLGTLAPTMPQ
jgi:putative copper resistance protein D